MRVHGIFKFGEREHLRQFREEGLLYCNNISFFRRIEGDLFRRDKRDGISASYLAKDVRVVIGDGPDSIEMNYATGLRGRVDLHLRGQDPNIFCMYALTDGSIPDKIHPRNLSSGDTVATIMDADAFRERVIAAATQQGLGLEARLVEYVDEDTHSGDLGPFRKLSRYSYQSEYRIAFYPGIESPRVIRIGSIIDITQEAPLADINRRIQIVVHESQPYGQQSDPKGTESNP